MLLIDCFGGLENSSSCSALPGYAHVTTAFNSKMRKCTKYLSTLKNNDLCFGPKRF